MELKVLSEKLFKNKSDHIAVQFFRYGFVGGLAFLVDFGTLYFLTSILKIHYLISAAAAIIIGLVVNYALSTFWVFTNRVVSNKIMEFIIFSIIGFVGLGLTELIMWFCTEIMLFHYLISKIIATVIVFLWNFIVRKFVLFR